MRRGEEEKGGRNERREEEEEEEVFGRYLSLIIDSEEKLVGKSSFEDG